MVNKVTFRLSVMHLMKVSSTLAGRDKFIRLLQYLSRLQIRFLLNTKCSSQLNLERWRKLARHLNSTRKLLRVGKAPEYVKAAADIITIDNADHFLQSLLSLRQILLAGYITLDNITVLDTLAVYPWKTARRLQVEASRLWLSAIICGLVAQLYFFYILKHLPDAKQASGNSNNVNFKHASNKLQLLTALFDLPIACSAANILSLSDGVIGVCGAASSLLGIANI